MTAQPGEVRFFSSAAEFRRWLAEHGEREHELWVGFYRKDAGKRGMTYSEALDQALCFGWIDGVRLKAGSEAYTNRFSPRQARSAWSAANLRRFEALRAQGAVAPDGIRAFEARDQASSGGSITERSGELAPEFEAQFRANRPAWAYFEQQASSYRRDAVWWVTSAKQQATRERRLAILIADCEAGQRIGVLNPPSRRRAVPGEPENIT